MKVLNLLATGGTGGIEVLCKNIAIESNIDNAFWFLFEEGEIYDELKKRGKKVFSSKNKNIWKTIKELEKYCNKENIDIVVVHHGGFTCNIIYNFLRKKCKNIKYVRFLHGCFDEYSFGNSENKIKNFIIKIGMKKALQVSDLIIYVSKAVRDSFHKNFNLNKVKEVIIYNGIGEEFFKIKENKRTSIKDRKYKIVFVGRVTKVKGVDILINAIKYLKDKNYNIKLTIVGDGEEKENLEKLTKELDLSKEVIFVGIQKNVINWLDESDIFIYPSVWQEAFGISVVEAMARGCIPVVSNHGGLTEIVDDGTNGYVVQKLDSENLAKTIEECINAEITGKGIDKIEIRKKAEQFSIDKTIERLEEEYGKILS